MTDFSQRDFRIAADKLILIRRAIIATLEEWLEQKEKDSNTLKALKTVNPVYTILGTLALFTPAAPLAPVLIGLGVTGSIVDSVIDYKVGDKIRNQLNELLKEERPYADKLEDMLRRLIELTNEMATNHSMDYNTAAALVVKDFAIGGIKGLVIAAEKSSVPTAKAAGKVISKLATSQKIVGVTASKVVAKQGARNAGRILKVLGPVSIAIDVADIIYTWNSDLPGVKDVKEVVEKLKSGIERVKEVKRMFYAA